MVLAVVIVLRVVDALPYNGIAWGGSRSEHPGFWLTKRETIYKRPVKRGEG